MANFIKHTFKNGLRLLVIPQKESPSVTVGIFVEAGAAYENQKNNGISHFLEHMCFKGTKKRPTPMDIASELAGLGALSNAFTSRDLTGYWAKVAYNKMDKVFDILADMYLNPVFNKKEIEKEKGVIIEEINMYEDQPRAKVSEELDKLMYGNQPAGWSIAGPKENIRIISQNDFIKYRSSHYHGSKTIVVIAGRIDTKKARQMVDKYFSNLDKGKRIISKNVLEKQNSPLLSIVKKDLDQTHFIFGLKSFALNSPKKYPLALLSEILGGGMSSRLFQKVREELGAAYYVGSSPSLFKTHGYLEIFAGVNHQKTFIAIKAILDELREILKNGINDKELIRAKDHYIGNLMLSLETSSDLAFFYGEQETILGKINSSQEIIKKLQLVSKKDVMEVAKQVFQNKGLNLAVIGPYKKESDFKKLLRI
ncbi:MAG: pitrilysin family protein [Candidatus Paceibacterota bacterium]|jgi:predicted Zn-dependent peptidase